MEVTQFANSGGPNVLRAWAHVDQGVARNSNRPTNSNRGSLRPPVASSHHWHTEWLVTVAAGTAGLVAGMRHRQTPRRFGAQDSWRATEVVARNVPLMGRSCTGPQRRSTSTGNEESGGILTKQTAPLLLLVLAFLYGANVPLLKLVETETQTLFDVTGPEVLALRFVTACIICLPWIALNMRKAMEVLKPGCELALWLFLGYSIQILGLEKTSATISAISIALVGVTVQILEVFVEKQPVRPLVVLSSLGVIGGLALFATATVEVVPGEAVRSVVDKLLNVFPSLQPPRVPLPHEAILAGVPGEALAVLGAVFFGIHLWRCNRIVGQADSKAAGGDFELALAIVQLVVTTLLCLAFSWLDSPFSTLQQVNSVERLGFNIWAQIAACGIACTGLPSLLELFAFKVVAPEVASLIYCTIPLWGTVLGVVLLKEPYGAQNIAGGLLILVSSLAPSLGGLFKPADDDEHSKVA